MRFWLNDDILRRVLLNTGQMGLGKVAGALIHIGSIALTARLLGPAEFGVLMLLRSFGQGVAAIAKFQSWQGFVHFGAAPYEAGDRSAVRHLWLRLGVIDLVVGVVAMVLGGWFAFEASPIVGIPPETAALAALYCLAVPWWVGGTPTGMLRLADRFDLVAWQSLVTPIVRLAGVVAAYFAGAPLWAIVLAWVVSDIMGEVFMWIAALVVAKGKGMWRAQKRPEAPAAENRVLWPYILGTNVNATLQQGALPLLTLAVGSVLGTHAAGAFRLAQTVLDAVVVPAELAMRSLFPEISKLRAQTGERLNQVMRRVGGSALAAGLPVALVLALIAQPLMQLLAGNGFGDSAVLLRILAATVPALFLAAIAETFMLSSGEARVPVLGRIVTNGMALVAILIVGEGLGLAGLGLVMLIASYVGLAVLLVPTLRRLDLQLRRRPSQGRARPE